MNTFNRFLVILLCISGVIFWSLLLVVVWTAPAEFGLTLTNLGRLFRIQPVMLQALITGVGLSCIVLGLLVLVGEFTPQRSRPVRIRGGEHETAEITTDAIAALLHDRLALLGGLAFAHATAQAVSADAVNLLVEAEALPNAHLDTVAGEISREAHQVVQTELGVSLRSVRVTFVDAHDGGLRADQPLPPAGNAIVVPTATPPAEGTPPSQS
jgi:hypothetical protein